MGCIVNHNGAAGSISLAWVGQEAQAAAADLGALAQGMFVQRLMSSHLASTAVHHQIMMEERLASGQMECNNPLNSAWQMLVDLCDVHHEPNNESVVSVLQKANLSAASRMQSREAGCCQNGVGRSPSQLIKTGGSVQNHSWWRRKASSLRQYRVFFASSESRLVISNCQSNN